MRPFTIHYTNNDEFLDHVENLTHERPSHCIYAMFDLFEELIVLVLHEEHRRLYIVAVVYSAVGTTKPHVEIYKGANHAKASELFLKATYRHANF